MATEQSKTYEIVVFAHTNLGTRIAFNAPHDITASAFKRDFERVHFTCLPDTGEIQVNGLMVKRKSCFYYLPDSLPIKYAFPGMRRTWFLHVEVRHLKSLCNLPQVLEKYLEPKELMTCNNEDKAKCNSEEKKMEGFHPPAYLLEDHEITNHHNLKKQKMEKGDSHKNYVQNAAGGTPEGCSYKFDDKPTGTTNKSQCVMPENKVENLVELSAKSMQGCPSEVISVTSIINKYFSGFNGIDNFNSPSSSDVTSRVVHSEIEVQSKTRRSSFSKRQIDSLPKLTPTKPPHVPLHVDLVSKNSGDKSGRCKVGKRLLVASRSLGASIAKKSPTLSFSRYKDGKLLEYKSQITGSIFSISDSDD